MTLVFPYVLLRTGWGNQPVTLLFTGLYPFIWGKMFYALRQSAKNSVFSQKAPAMVLAMALAFVFQVVSPSYATSGNSITVQVSGGPASSTVDVSITGPTSTSPQPLSTDPSGAGTLTISSLADGSYSVNVSKTESGHKTYKSETTSVSVTGDQSVTASVSLIQLTSISVTVSGIPANTSVLSGSYLSTGNISVAPTTTNNPTSTQVVDLYEVPAGSWSLTFSADSSASGSTNVVVSAGTPATASVTLAQTNTATGVVRDGAGNPVNNATVSLGSQGFSATNPCGSGNCYANTDSSGAFSIAGLNTHLVSATVTATFGSTTIAKSGINITLVPGTPIQLTLPTGTASLSGTVKNDSTEAAISGVTVRLYFTGMQNSNLTVQTTTDSNGAYTAEHLPAGSAMVSASKYTGPNSLYLDSNDSISIADGQTKTLNIYLRDRPTGSGILTGTVSNSINSNGIQNASVNITNVLTSVYSYGSTDSSGVYSISNLPDGVYRVSISATNYLYRSGMVNIVGGSVTKNFALTAKPTGNKTVSGTVRDSRTGLALSGVNINLYSTNGTFHSTQSGSDGTWAVSNVADGTYNFNLNAPMGSNLIFAYEERPPVVVNGSNVVRNDGLRSVVAGTGSITGTLKNAITHEPLAGATMVAAVMSSGFSIEPVTTNSKGEFSFTGLPAGQIMVNADLEGYVGIQIVDPEDSEQGGGFGPGYPVGTIDLDEGEQAKLYAKLRPEITGSNTISGVVRTSLNRPIENMYVNLRTEAGLYIPGVQTDANGYFEFDGIADGDYILSSSSYSSSYGMSEARFTVSGADVVRNLTLAPSGLVTGSVLDVDGKPVSCAVVTAYRVNNDGSRGEIVSSSMADFGTAQVPGTGQYSLSYLAQGNYYLRISQQCWNTTTPVTTNFASGFWSNSTPAITETAEVTVAVVAGAVTPDKNFVVGNTGASITGKIVTSTPQGEVGLAVGKYATVSIYKLVNGTYQVQGYLTRWVSGREGGIFTLNGLPSGRYKVKITDPMNSSRGVATTFLGGADLASAEVIEISAGDEIQLGNIVVTQKVPTEAPTAVETSDLTVATEDQIDAPTTVEANETISVNVGEDMAGEWVSVWAHSTPTSLGDWVQVAADGTVTATVSEALPAGNHRIVVQDVDDRVIGWTGTTVAASVEGSSSTGGQARKVVGSLNNIGTAVPGLDSPVKISPKKSSKADSTANEESEASSSLNSDQPNIWVFGGLAAVLAAGLAGAVWLIRTRKN